MRARVAQLVKHNGNMTEPPKEWLKKYSSVFIIGQGWWTQRVVKTGQYGFFKWEKKWVFKGLTRQHYP